jgi:Bacterial Ig-like domain (group 1)
VEFAARSYKVGWYMRIFASITILAALALGLAACGGSGDAAFVAPPTGTGGKTTAATIGLTASSATIPSDGSASSTITAHATDASNSAVSGASVTFSSSAGTISGSPATTDANGNATATLAAGTAPAGTAITVTATSGSASGTTKVTVANTKQTITLETSSPQIPSDGSKPATITALVRDASNNFVTGATVQFSSTSGGLTVTNGTTDANGAATAVLTDAGDQTSRTIDITATVGNATATVPVTVIGTAVSITGASNLVLNGMGTYTVALTDSSGKGIAGKTIAITSSISGNAVTPASVTTDSTGHATFTLTASGSGTDTLSAVALGQTGTLAVKISSSNLVFNTPAVNTFINLGSIVAVTVTLTAPNAANQPITFAATRGVLSGATPTTDATGHASVNISSATAGPATISATSAGVTSELNVDFIATTPASLTVQASPATIATQGQSTITAVVRDAQNNLVEGKIVDFTTVNDVTGGSLSVASSVTDVQGKAQTVYTATNTTSAKNGVVLRATVPGFPAATGTTDLTVGGQTVFLSLGTGNTIIELNNTQYELPYAVQAIDAGGNAIDGADVTLTVSSVSYEKGAMVFNGTNWAPVYSVTPACPSEDGDYNFTGLPRPGENNGILDPGEDGTPITPAQAAAGYTVNPEGNQNGKLEPGLVASVTPANLTTSNGGTGLLNLIYPKDHAYWVTVTLAATATVQGTQASTEATFVLPGASADYNSATVQPPGPVSPYGTANSCTNPN